MTQAKRNKKRYKDKKEGLGVQRDYEREDSL